MVARAGTSQGREGTGPVLASCEVLSRRREGSYWVLSFAAKEIAQRAEPGQFVQVGVGADHTLLRRPFSIARVSQQGSAAGSVEVVFDAHGPGTSWLTSVSAHDVVEVVGPLGRPFPLPQRNVNCLLVGGGYGTAPLFYLAEQLLAQRLRVDMIVGAGSADRLMGTIEAKRLSSSVAFTTDDGSYGTQGQVTDVLEDMVRNANTGVVYACGPNPMLRAVSEACQDLGIAVQVAVEEHMACGIGVCFTCVLPVEDRDGNVTMRRSCIDGPVFNGARIAWDQSRYGVPDPVAPDVEEAAPEAPSAPTESELWGDA